jgi:hypothetical protein
LVTYQLLNATNNQAAEKNYKISGANILALNPTDRSNIGIKLLKIVGSVVGTYKTYNQDS